MIQAVNRNKNRLVLLGTALALMLATACGSDSTENGSPANIAEFLTSSGGYSAAARLLESDSIESTGIWVNGAGKATGDPDLGILNLGVEALADRASEARSMAAGAIEVIISVLRSNKIHPRDMQTSQFSINPRYNTQEIRLCTNLTKEKGSVTDRASLGMPAPDSPDTVEKTVINGQKGTECHTEFEKVLIGYQVTNTLTVKVRNLDSMGSIIDGASEAAGNLVRINNVSFIIEDSKALQNMARQEAIADLLTKANSMASLAGIELGKLVFLSESEESLRKPFARMESTAFGFVGDQPTDILSGNLDVYVNVQGVFTIAD
jgi:hypothetical protein